MITIQAVKVKQPERDMIEQATQEYLKKGKSINVVGHTESGVKEGRVSSTYGRSYKI